MEKKKNEQVLQREKSFEFYMNSSVHVKMVRMVNPMWFLQIKLNDFNTSFKRYNLK